MKEVSTLVGQRIYLNLKSITTNALTMILLFAIPTLFCSATIVFLPIKYNFEAIIVPSVMLISFITYGTIAGSFRRSTLNKNSNLTIAVRWVDNLATIGTMVILSLLVITFLLVVLTIFNLAGMMWITTTQKSNQFEFSFFFDLDLILIYYNVLLVSIISYSLSYLFQGFFDSDMMFFTLAIILFILFMLFGATINNYFWMNDSGVIEFSSNQSLYGENFYIPSLLFPFYAPSQVIRIQGDIMVNGNPNSIWMFIDGANAWKWNIIWFVPYFHIVFWWVIGFAWKVTRD